MSAAASLSTKPAQLYHQKNHNKHKKTAVARPHLESADPRQASKVARMSGLVFRDMPKSNQSLLSAVYVADAVADVMKDSKSK